MNNIYYLQKEAGTKTNKGEIKATTFYFLLSLKM